MSVQWDVLSLVKSFLFICGMCSEALIHSLSSLCSENSSENSWRRLAATREPANVGALLPASELDLAQCSAHLFFYKTVR